MYKQHKIQISSIENLYKYILEQEDYCSNLVILGGHFMLIYDEEENILKPAIWNEHIGTDLENMSKIVAGNFPLASLNFSLVLHKKIKNKKYNSKILLLVNDHLFQSKNLRILYRDSFNGGSLRRNYYQQESIPNSYLKLLENQNIDKSVLLNESVNGENTRYLFSETKLRKKFDRSLKKRATTVNGFFEKRGINKKSELYFSSDDVDTICLTEEGECGCSGEVTQLLFEVFNRGFNNLLLLVPDECNVSVNNGIAASLILSEKLIKIKSNKKIIVASGFGDLDFVTSHNSNDMIVTEHNLLSDYE